MTTEFLFHRGNELAARSPDQIAAYLTEIGDPDARLFLPGAPGGQGWNPYDRAWHRSGCALGFIAPGYEAPQQPIVSVSQIAVDGTLINTRIKITLDRFFVQKYPGVGTHEILCEFAGKNQVSQETEALKFAMRVRARDGSSAAVSGAPIFSGLTVGPDGIAFEGKLVNVKSDADEMLLSTLDSQAFKAGLSLIQQVQPALRPFADLTSAAVKNVLSRSHNREVHSFNLGLDFGQGATSARLALGSYVVAQIDDGDGLDWNDYEWLQSVMTIRHRQTGAAPEFNYMIFGIAAFSAA